MSTYSQWEADITQAIADKHEITYNDAAGIVEGQQFYLAQSWAKGLDAEQTAAKISEAAGL